MNRAEVGAAPGMEIRFMHVGGDKSDRWLRIRVLAGMARAALAHWRERLAEGRRRRRARRAEPEHLRAGRWGEDCAAAELKARGYVLLGRRVAIRPREELDIVARTGETLVFVEVKTRRREKFGRAIGAVNRRKRRQLSLAALHYLRRLSAPPPYLRFDVVEVIGRPGAEAPPVIRHIENAFPLDRRYRWPGR